MPVCHENYVAAVVDGGKEEHIHVFAQQSGTIL